MMLGHRGVGGSPPRRWVLAFADGRRRARQQEWFVVAEPPGQDARVTLLGGVAQKSELYRFLSSPGPRRRLIRLLEGKLRDVEHTVSGGPHLTVTKQATSLAAACHSRLAVSGIWSGSGSDILN